MRAALSKATDSVFGSQENFAPLCRTRVLPPVVPQAPAAAQEFPIFRQTAVPMTVWHWEIPLTTMRG